MASGDRVSAATAPEASRRAGKVDEAVGSRLRSARVDAGLTLEELAARVGISAQQLFKYESGASRIAVSRLISFAEALKTDVSNLIALHGHVTAPSGPHHAEILRLVTSFCEIKSVAGRLKIIEMAEFIAGFESTDN